MVADKIAQAYLAAGWASPDALAASRDPAEIAKWSRGGGIAPAAPQYHNLDMQAAREAPGGMAFGWGPMLSALNRVASGDPAGYREHAKLNTVGSQRTWQPDDPTLGGRVRSLKPSTRVGMPTPLGGLQRAAKPRRQQPMPESHDSFMKRYGR